MHRYRLIEYKAGATVEVIRCIPGLFRKGSMRSGPGKSKEEIKQANKNQAARRLARKINANFRPGDLHVILTYRREERQEPKEAQKMISKFLKDLRKCYQKAGKLLKYILVTEYKKKAVHHHLIINNINDGNRTTQDYIRDGWKGRGSPKYVQLYDDGEYEQLAEYLIKETEETFREKNAPFRQRYSCSRNLIDPKAKQRTVKVKNGWELEPKPRSGYYIKKDSLYNGFDKMGYPYQRYLLVKECPEESDWPSDDWKPGNRKKRRKTRVHRGN